MKDDLQALQEKVMLRQEDYNVNSGSKNFSNKGATTTNWNVGTKDLASFRKKIEAESVILSDYGSDDEYSSMKKDDLASFQKEMQES